MTIREAITELIDKQPSDGAAAVQALRDKFGPDAVTALLRRNIQEALYELTIGDLVGLMDTQPGGPGGRK